MIDKKKIFEELYDSNPGLKLEEEKIEKLVGFLVVNNPNIEAPKAFKTRLGNKLTTIGEFKQIQPKTKYNSMFFIRPLFVLVVGVFVLAQFKNYLSIKEVNMRTSSEIQNLEMLIPDDLKTTIGEGEEEIQIEELGENEQEIIIEDNSEQSLKLTGNSDISSSEASSIETSETNNDTNSEQANLQEPVSDNQITPEEDNNGEERETGPRIEPESSEPDMNTEPQESQDTEETSRSSAMTTSDQNDMTEDSSTEQEYYTCENGEIVVEDSIAQRRIIKSYCDSVGGEIMNSGGNIKYYLCTLPSEEEVGIDYIGRQLCE